MTDKSDHIDGQSVGVASQMVIEVGNPVSGEPPGAVPGLGNIGTGNAGSNTSLTSMAEAPFGGIAD